MPEYHPSPLLSQLEPDSYTQQIFEYDKCSDNVPSKLLDEFIEQNKDVPNGIVERVSDLGKWTLYYNELHRTNSPILYRGNRIWIV